MRVAQRHYHESGVTSLVVVMFSTLLFVIVSVGFMQQMLAEQRSSIDNELSRGAYDSALAGVEDGKRVLERCFNEGSMSSACAAIQANVCNTVRVAGIIGSDTGSTEEVLIQSLSGGGADYDQAYTCVKINRTPNDYIGRLEEDTSNVIPLRTVDAFDTVRVEWFTRANSSSEILNNGGPGDTSVLLPARSAWPDNRPPIMRLQLIRYRTGDAVQPDYFDTGDHMSTMYLYPRSTGTNTPTITRAEAEPVGVSCNDNLSMIVYACRADVRVPSSSGFDTYIRITPIYGEADFSITPLAGAVPARLDNVQPAIDSTGRAGDVFRRVESRVERSPVGVPYPRATVDITGNLCKTMRITNNPGDYSSGSCTP